MNYFTKKALIELAKSFGRFMWFGLLGLVSTFLVGLTTDADLMNSVWTFNGVSLQVGVWIVAAIGFAAKALDQYIHKNKAINSNGIAPKFLQG